MTPEEIAAEELRLKTEQEAAEKLAKEEDAAFDEGFQNVPTGTPSPAVEPVVQPAAEPVLESTPEPTPEPTAEQPVVEKPKLAEMTEAQFQEILTKMANVDEVRQTVEKRFNDAFGKMGGLERTLKQIQEATPAGQAIVVTKDDLAELNADFPELTEKMVSGLTKVFSKMKGTGPAITPEQVSEWARPLVESAIVQTKTEIRQENAVERLAERYPEWQKVVGPEGSETDFRKWLHTQDPVYEAKILDSWNPREIGDSIEKFTTEQKKKVTPPVTPPVTPKAGGDARSQRLAEAVSARGSSAPSRPRELSEDEAFEAGFKSGRS